MSEPVSEAAEQYGTDEWADATFPNRGEAPSNDVQVDPSAPRAPNVERPCEGEVSDD